MKSAPTSGVQLPDQRCFVVLSMVRLWSLYFMSLFFYTDWFYLIIFFQNSVARNYLQRCREGGREGSNQPSTDLKEKLLFHSERSFKWDDKSTVASMRSNALWNNLMSFMLFVACQGWWWRNWFDMTDLSVCVSVRVYVCVCAACSRTRVQREEIWKRLRFTRLSLHSVSQLNWRSRAGAPRSFHPIVRWRQQALSVLSLH